MVGRDAPTPSAETAVRTRQEELAETLRSTVRPNTGQSELLTPAMAPAIRQRLNVVFNGPQRELVLDDLAEQNTTPTRASAPAINLAFVAPRVPPRIIEVLSPLPPQLEYDFVERALILRDVDADVVVDSCPM